MIESCFLNCDAQRCAKEDSAAHTFWKNETKKRAVRQAALCDGSSIATSTWVSNDSTIATMVRDDEGFLFFPPLPGQALRIDHGLVVCALINLLIMSHPSGTEGQASETGRRDEGMLPLSSNGAIALPR